MKLTVNSDKSTANDSASCSVFGSSDKNDTTGNRPHLSNDIRFSGSLTRDKFRLCGKNFTNLNEMNKNG